MDDQSEARICDRPSLAEVAFSLCGFIGMLSGVTLPSYYAVASSSTVQAEAIAVVICLAFIPAGAIFAAILEGRPARGIASAAASVMAILITFFASGFLLPPGGLAALALMVAAAVFYPRRPEGPSKRGVYILGGFLALALQSTIHLLLVPYGLLPAWLAATINLGLATFVAWPHARFWATKVEIAS